MYYEHFGLRTNPFRPAPSGEFFFAGSSHREALAALQWGLSDPTGLVLLTGDVGTGKTTVVRELLSREAHDLRTALISNPKLAFDELLQSIVRQIGVEPPAGRAQLLEALNGASEKQRVVVVIDEAQQLSDEALEEFRLLSNSSPERLQLMLVGQPELLDRLSTPNLRQLNQRIAIRAVLNPLAVPETIEYLEHRVRAAGGDARRIFARRAMVAIARLSYGIPRRVNLVSHNAMLAAYSDGARKICLKHALIAANEYDHPGEAGGTFDWTITRRLLIPILLLMAGLAFTFLHGTQLVIPGPRPAATASEVRPRRQVATAPRLTDPDPARTVQVSQPVTASIPAAAEDRPAIAAPQPAENPRPVAHAVGQSVEPAASTPRIAEAGNAPAGNDEVTVRAGDTLSSIAERYSPRPGTIAVQNLIAVNPEIKNANLIYPGEKVRLR